VRFHLAAPVVGQGVDTALNVTHVDDLALGHLAALEVGRSYILGAENLSMRAILQMLADCTGLPVPRIARSITTTSTGQSGQFPQRV
jgi:nucleoside-diphosphate-sugar epimerase